VESNNFFEAQTASSKIKASIISEYFPKYCNIIKNRHVPKMIRYIDLFAGPGKYKDGNPSTPILIAKHCCSNPYLKNNVWMIFNDNQLSKELQYNFIQEFPDGTFKHKPHFGCSTVGEKEEITKFLIESTHENGRNEMPSLLFIDPFGYKGIETKVLAEFLKNWGNEIFLFVNTKRIHPALENEKFEDLMIQLFPTTLSTIKHDRKYTSSVSERLALIIDSLGKEYESIIGGKIYYTAFKFQEEDIDTTSHYILHITKGKKGFDLIKTIYNDFANVGTMFDGVNTYTFDAKYLENTIELFDVKSMNIDVLKDEIYRSFKGKNLNANDLYEEHHVTGLYCRSHYTEALRRLVSEEKLLSVFTDNKNHIKTVLLSKDCQLTFK
jgi:three-Cys-motif partner protein